MTIMATSEKTSRPVSPTSKRRAPGRRRKKGRLANLLAIIFCLVWILPVYWMLNTAFKPRSAVLTSTPQFVPHEPTLRNFNVAITQTDFLIDLRNSVIVVGSALVVAIVLGFFAAAALSRFKFRGRRTVMVTLLIVQMMPMTSLLIPMFIVFSQAGLLGTYYGLILAYVAIVLPFSIWVMRGFFVTIPTEIDEAARIDGASTWQILTRIWFPLVGPGVIATGIFAFITAWNDYMFASVFMKSQSMYTLPVWLASFQTPMTGTDFGGQMAGSVLFSLPVVIFFLFVQRRLVAGISAGAVKG